MRAGWLLLFCGTTIAQAPVSLPSGTRQITFTMDRSIPAPTHYEVQLDAATGKGTYRQAGSAATAEVGAGAASAQAAEAPIAVDPAMLKKLLASSAAIERHRCESHNTNVAQTGKKTLRLTEGPNAADCTFNYSDDERVNTATSLFEAISETMQYGQRLSAELRFDRLGLDAEMTNLEDAVKGGRAAALGNIAPLLQNIIGDERVLERVRRKATSLLTTAGVAVDHPAAGGGSSDL